MILYLCLAAAVRPDVGARVHGWQRVQLEKGLGHCGGEPDKAGK